MNLYHLCLRLQASYSVAMATADAEPVAGPSHSSGHLTMTSSRPLRSQTSSSVCLPMSVQHLSYDGGRFFDDDDDGPAADIDVASEAAGPPVCPVTHNTTSSSADDTVCLTHALLTL